MLVGRSLTTRRELELLYVCLFTFLFTFFRLHDKSLYHHPNVDVKCLLGIVHHIHPMLSYVGILESSVGNPTIESKRVIVLETARFFPET